MTSIVVTYDTMYITATILQPLSGLVKILSGLALGNGTDIVSLKQWAEDHHSAVVGSIIDLISDTRFAGKPPWRACSRTISTFGAM